MGRVISDLGSFSETVANGDLLVCHNVSKAVNARDEKLPVEKFVQDMVHKRRNPFAIAQGLYATKTVDNNTATDIADLTKIGGGGVVAGAVLAGLEVQGTGIVGSALYAVVWAWSSETATVLSSQLFAMSSLTMTVYSDTMTPERVRFTVTQVNPSAVACTVRLSVFPISAYTDREMTLTAL